MEMFNAGDRVVHRCRVTNAGGASEGGFPAEVLKVHGNDRYDIVYTASQDNGQQTAYNVPGPSSNALPRLSLHPHRMRPVLLLLLHPVQQGD